jgi:hypothetical protein
MNKITLILVLFFSACLTSGILLPPNELQYNYCCDNVLDCNVVSDDEIRACIDCVDKVGADKESVLNCLK